MADKEIDPNEVETESINIANDIEALCAGKSTAAVYMALSMVIGRAEARSPNPNLLNLMVLIGEAACGAFIEYQRERRNASH